MSQANLPAPLVEPDVNLSDFPFIPLYIERLRRSKAWLQCKRRPELGFYMVNLWGSCWHEQPAGSLENDDDVLADRAMCNPELWPSIKAQVLHGWILCNDGRYYHPVVAELAIDAWQAKLVQRNRTAAARAARGQIKPKQEVMQFQPRLTEDDTKTVTEPVIEIATEPVTTSATGTKGQGQGERERKKTTARDSKLETNSAPAKAIIAAFDAELVAAFGPERYRLWPNQADFVLAKRWCEGGATEDFCRPIFSKSMVRMAARGAPPPGSLAYFDQAMLDALGAANARSELPPAVVPKANGQIPSRMSDPDEQDREHLRRWKRTGVWPSPWGPIAIVSPGQINSATTIKLEIFTEPEFADMVASPPKPGAGPPTIVPEKPPAFLQPKDFSKPGDPPLSKSDADYWRNNIRALLERGADEWRDRGCGPLPWNDGTFVPPQIRREMAAEIAAAQPMAADKFAQAGGG